MVDTVLVTGGTGYVATHCILALLEQGYRVRTTLRSAGRVPDVQEMIAEGGQSPDSRLTFVEAELTDDRGWSAATAGVRYVLHVASPFPRIEPANADDLITPAVEGTRRVLRASADASVERVVMTSSFQAVAYGHPDHDGIFTEDDWTNPEGQSPLVQSKTLAERAAWQFVEEEAPQLSLTTLCPVGVFGPVLGPDFSTSIKFIDELLRGRYRFIHPLQVNIVDVRDLAELHVTAMDHPDAGGQRFLALAGSARMKDLCRLLRDELPNKADKVPWMPAPAAGIKLAAKFNAESRLLLPYLVNRPASNDKAITTLGWEPRDMADTLVDCAESLTDLIDSEGNPGMPVFPVRSF